jgi:hypothetical protein
MVVLLVSSVLHYLSCLTVTHLAVGQPCVINNDHLHSHHSYKDRLERLISIAMTQVISSSSKLLTHRT